jgi:putative hydrolase of the HAD superfamily
MPVRGTPKVCAVVFDFGGVLCFHPSDQQMDRVAAACGLPTPQFLRAFWANRIPYDAGRISPVEYWHKVAETAGIAFPEESIPALVRIEVDLWSRYDQRVLQWVSDLRSAGYRTGILSNLPRPLGEELRATPGFLDGFDHVTFSYELGAVKPEPDIYLNMLYGLAVEPQEALFLDDRPENVAGARAVGMVSELFSDWESCAAKLPARYALTEPAVARPQ